MKLKPLGDKILVQRLEAEEKTASGIFLPESAKEKPQQAKVVRVGTGKVTEDGKTLDFQVKEGDTILLSKWGGTEVKLDGQDYIVMSEDEVLAVVG
ncbi:MAG: co-chaperone GroES [Planctomycetota bacterium]